MTSSFGIDVQTVRGRDTALVLAIAALSGLIAGTAASEPTGLLVWDFVLKFLLAGVVVLAASRAQRWVVVVFTSIAAAAAGISIWAVAGLVALLVALAATLLQTRSRPVSALAAAIAVQVLLRLPGIGFFGLPSLVAGLACLFVLVSGYRYAGRPARRWSRRAASILGVLAVLACLIGGLSLLSARSDVEQGVRAAQRGLEAARGGDPALVASELERAETALGNAERQADSLAAQPLRLIPIAAQHQRAIQVATEQGAAIAREAAGAAREADLDTITLRAGSVDLRALQAMAPRLRSTAAALEAGVERIGDVRSGWLLPMVQGRVDELFAEIEELLPEAKLAADAVEVVPELLGVSGNRSYFVMFGTPAEAREGGGLLGSWARLTADNGNLAIAESGRISELYSVAADNEIPEGVVTDFFLRMARPSQYPQNLTSSADFSTVAAAAHAIFDGAFDTPVDGYLYIDTWALIDLLELSGPVDIPFQDQPLTQATAPQFFFEDQYRVAELNRTELFDVLAAVAGSVMQTLATSDLPGPEELGRVLGPAARAGRLQMVTFDDAENDFLRSVRLLRDFGVSDATDFLALVQTNGTASKLDIYLDRHLDYQVSMDSDGVHAATVTMTLTSSIPEDAPSYTLGAEQWSQTNRVLLSLYSQNILEGVSIDGEDTAGPTAIEFDMGRYLVDVAVPPDGLPVVVQFETSGFQNSDVPYTLELWHQPLVNSDTVRVDYVGPDGSFVWEGELLENVVLDSSDLAQ